jgi:predicted chitinase
MADPIVDAPIPDTPPPEAKLTGHKAQIAMKGIKAIKEQMIAGGFTSKYAQCAVLAIAGGESAWQCIAEGYPHSYKLLTSGKFSNVSEADAQKYSNAKKNGISKVEYFGWLYGTRLRKSAAEGNYYGRGYIQLTFSDAYDKMSKRIGDPNIDLLKNPELLEGESDEAILTNAKYVVAFLKWKMKDWKTAQHSPGFMEYALKAVGGLQDRWPLKRRYNEYFLGGKPAPAPASDKDPATSTIQKTPKEIATAPPHKKEAYTEPRDENFDKNGFTDPEGKYPLRDYMNEPDTNRLARGILKGTNIEYKDQTRHKSIPTPNGGSYEQPRAGFSSVYPYNKVFESESGHVLEFDDSPAGERVNLYHKKGTFIEIDANGTQVNHIIGDGYYIVEHNGNIFVNGCCNITINGNTNLLCGGDATVEVNGTSDIILHNDANIGVAKDLNIAVGGDMNVLVEGNYNLEVGKTFNTRTIGTMSLESNDALKLKTQKNISMEGGDTQSTAETLMKLSGDIKIETDGAYQIKAKSIQFETTETLKLNAGGQLSAKGTKINLNDPDETIPTLDKLGTPKKPVDFKGDTKSNTEEHVLVDTSLNPAGEFNPNTLSESVMDSVINKLPLSDDIKGLFGGTTPDVYDKKYADQPIETKTSLQAAGVSKGRLVVPPVAIPNNTILDNLPSPDRISEMRYDTEEDAASVKGAKAIAARDSTEEAKDELANRESSTNTIKDDDGNIVDAPSLSGGSSSSKGLSADKKAEIDAKSDFPMSYPLSKHFTLGMLIKDKNVLRDQMLPGGKSEKAGTPTRMYTKQELVANLAALCENCLEPIYDLLGPCTDMSSNGTWKINSGLRNPGSVAGSGDGSDHNKGRACDFQLHPKRSITEMYTLVMKIEKLLPYNQLIFEYRNGGASNWIHVSYSTQGNQKRAFTMINDKPVNSSGQPASGSTGLFKFFAKD